MKCVIRVQSISDIITNSSSEVFIMSSEAAKEFEGNSCTSIEYLETLEGIKNNWTAQNCLEENPGMKPEDLIGCAIVDIEDHYEDWKSDGDLARSFSFYSQWNH